MTCLPAKAGRGEQAGRRVCVVGGMAAPIRKGLMGQNTGFQRAPRKRGNLAGGARGFLKFRVLGIGVGVLGF
jgi:hypothetical protein